ncbi:MAG: acyl-CoA dehydrogenase family protein [Acidimicrobiales bacterium]|jgi:alkylation response protein AidB-like acyl-CoA dehydrogenase|nr:acyl-CoA dehydrogenase family protein [Acidimicrobiales bacterium]HCK74111.1 acyl-CoA dehydrogenase [Acidimicrobiaceae bacterium]|tara:strand:- start:1585 stop:2841 length:1257 start_codon:yes stop_codon:yes gene_type:complete
MTSTLPESVKADAQRWFAEYWDPDLPLGQWWQLLADSGWAFPSWPEGFGGRGLSSAATKAAVQARREAGAFGPPNGVATFLAAPTIMHYGTEEQKRKYIPKIVNGQEIWCQLFSEPGAGSDMAGLATKAIRDGDEWIVNGQKVWNSGAQWAQYGILIARTDPQQPKHRGITYFLIDMEQDGVDVRPLKEMTGDAAFNEVFLNDARVAESDRLGDLGDGWRVAMTTLSHERDPDNAGMGDTAAFGEIDLAESVGEYSATLSSKNDGFSLALSGGVTRVLEGVTSQFEASEDPKVRQKLASILEMRRTSRWSGMRAAAKIKSGGQPGPEVSTLKLLGSEMGRQIRDVGLESMGAHGMLYGQDAPVDGLFHAYSMFTPAQSIAGGSDEVQRNIIGERVLGLPREPGEKEQRELPWSELPRS